MKKKGRSRFDAVADEIAEDVVPSWKIDYGRDFEKRMLRVLFADQEFATTAGVHLNHQLFSTPALRWLAQKVVGYARDNGTGIGKDALRIELERDGKTGRVTSKNREAIEALVDTIDRVVKDRTYVKDELFKFIKNQVTDRVVRACLDHLDAQDFDAIDSEVQKILDVQSALNGGLGHFFVRDRLARRERRRKYVPNGVSTGLFLDEKLKPKGIPPKSLTTVVAPSGVGKCLAVGTEVMRHDGRVIRVEDVAVGDKLMGPDGKPRTVMSTNRGTGQLYRVVPTKGDSWVCNDEHVLTLVDARIGQLVDVPIRDYMSGGSWFKTSHKQVLVGVDFELRYDDLPIDPYFLGVWFGDGTKDLGGVNITKPDPEIEALCRSTASTWGLQVTKIINTGGCPTWNLVSRTGAGKGSGKTGYSNDLLDALRELVGPRASVPFQYMTSSRAERSAFLAGVLDTDGHLVHGCFELVQKRRDYIDAFAFISRSLGLRATIRGKIVNGDIYWRCFISGDVDKLPLRIARKKPSPRRQIKDVTRTGITIEDAGVGAYAGFTLSGDGRFLLGDFTVTHNSGVLMFMCRSAVINSSAPSLYVTTELSEEIVADRLDASFSGVSINMLEKERKRVSAKVRNLGLKRGEFLVIKEFPPGVLTPGGLRAYIRQLERVGFYPKSIYIDSPDDMVPDPADRGRDKDGYEDYGAVYRGNRRLSYEVNAPVSGASQTQRGALNKEHVDWDSIADSAKKVMVSDVVFILQQTREEHKQKVGRFYLAKNRFGSAKWEWKVRLDWGLVDIRTIG